MNALDLIKNQIKQLYEASPDIHISISFSHPKIIFTNDPITIKGVYPHVFCIKEKTAVLQNVIRCNIRTF